MATKTRRKPEPEAATLPPGTLIMCCRIPLRAVPWSAPTVIHGGKPYKGRRLVKWQQAVAVFARTSLTSWVPGDMPYDGPVQVDVMATFAKGPLPDATNVLKAIEDAIQGVVILNDRQVTRNSCERTKGETDLVTIAVRAAGGGA